MLTGGVLAVTATRLLRQAASEEVFLGVAIAMQVFGLILLLRSHTNLSGGRVD